MNRNVWLSRILIVTTLLVSGCDANLKNEVETQRKQILQLTEILTQLAENQQQWPPDRQETARLEISDVSVVHQEKAFQEVLIVKATLKPELARYYNFEHSYVVLAYEVSIPEKNWNLEGKWEGAVTLQASNSIELEVLLPELGIKDEEIDIAFKGVGFSPLLPINVSRSE